MGVPGINMNMTLHLLVLKGSHFIPGFALEILTFPSLLVYFGISVPTADELPTQIGQIKG